MGVTVGVQRWGMRSTKVGLELHLKLPWIPRNDEIWVWWKSVGHVTNHDGVSKCPGPSWSSPRLQPNHTLLWLSSMENPLHGQKLQLSQPCHRAHPLSPCGDTQTSPSKLPTSFSHPHSHQISVPHWLQGQASSLKLFQMPHCILINGVNHE